MEAKAKLCSKCGEPFYCFANTGVKCWCEDITLTKETLDLLKREFNDCLCPECLPDWQADLPENSRNS
jgi:hypothetical protein